MIYDSSGQSRGIVGNWQRDKLPKEKRKKFETEGTIDTDDFRIK